MDHLVANMPESACLIHFSVGLGSFLLYFCVGLQVLILALFMGFLFFRIERLPDSLDMSQFRGVTFITILDMTLFSMGQLPLLFQERPVYYKQQGAHFFRPSTYLFAKIFGSIPFSLAEVCSKFRAFCS